MYIQWHNATVPLPNIQLAAFTRTTINVKETVSIGLSIPARVRAAYTNRLVLQPGLFTVLVGGGQPGPSLGGRPASNLLTGQFKVQGLETDLAECP